MLDLVRVMTGGPHHGAAGKDRMNSRKLLLGSAVAVLAAAVAAGAMAGNGKHSSVTTVKAINKAPVIVVNRYIQDNLRWDKDVYKVASGGTIHVVNMAADEGPHTFTIVAEEGRAEDRPPGLQLQNLQHAREGARGRIRTATRRRSSRSSRTASARRRLRRSTGPATPGSPARARRASRSTCTVSAPAGHEALDDVPDPSVDAGGDRRHLSIAFASRRNARTWASACVLALGVVLVASTAVGRQSPAGTDDRLLGRGRPGHLEHRPERPRRDHGRADTARGLGAPDGGLPPLQPELEASRWRTPPATAPTAC